MLATSPRLLALLAVLLAAVGLLAPAASADEGDNAPPVALDDELNTARGTPGDATSSPTTSTRTATRSTIQTWTQATEGLGRVRGHRLLLHADDPGFVGVDSFTYTVSDGNGGTDVGLVVVSVTYTNEQPVADDDVLTTAEDTAGNVDVLDGDTDEDGDQLTVVTEAPDADHGTVSCTPEGICTYTPTADFNGSDSFTYTIEDGAGGDDAGEVTVTVTPVNDDPEAVANSLVVTEDEQGVAERARQRHRPGRRHAHRDHSVSYGRARHRLLPVRRPLHVHAGRRLQGARLLPVRDLGRPGRHRHGDGQRHRHAGEHPSGRRRREPDDRRGRLQLRQRARRRLGRRRRHLERDDAAPTAAHGTVSCSAGGSCTYTPEADWNGADSFTYTVADGRGGTDAGLVSVTVTPVNDAPVAGDDTLSADEDDQGQTDVLANDADIDGGALSVTGSTNGAHGAVSCDPGGMCTYTPAADYSGSDTFTYTVSDGNGGTDTGSVEVTVAGVNDAPVADDDTLTTTVDIAGDVDVLAGDLDADGDELEVEAASDPEHGSVTCDPAGLCTYTPDPGYLGADSFTYTVGDGLATDEGLVSVTVEEPNVAPSCANVKPSKTTLWPPGRQFVLVTLAGASDANGDTLTFAITTVKQDEKVKGIGGSADKGPDAQRVSGKPAQIRLRAERDLKANGRVYRVAYTVSDGRGGTCTGLEKVGVPVKKGKKAVETAKSFNSFG